MLRLPVPFSSENLSFINCRSARESARSLSTALFFSRDKVLMFKGRCSLRKPEKILWVRGTPEGRAAPSHIDSVKYFFSQQSFCWPAAVIGSPVVLPNCDLDHGFDMKFSPQRTRCS
ncbi:hypothetical protein MTP99_014253 [Tenebrio molitor]|nr:hypothetical protein MTP99_014253 [Tenebrio molitor]